MMVPVTATIGTQIIVTFAGSLTKPLEIVDVDDVVPGAEVVVVDVAGVVLVSVVLVGVVVVIRVVGVVVVIRVVGVVVVGVVVESES